MKKNTILKIINPIMGILLINQVLMALMHDILPHELFEVFHVGGGFILTVVAIVHIILNWNWVKSNFFRKA